eukprot:Gb_35897 [translate_table: standard]
MNEKKFTIAAETSVTMDIPKRLGIHRSHLQTDSLRDNNDLLHASSDHSLAELNDVNKDGQKVLGNPLQISEGVSRHSFKVFQGGMNSMSSTLTDRDVDDTLPFDKEANSKLSHSVLSHPKGLAETSSSPSAQEENLPSMSSLLFGDQDEEEEVNLFGPLPKSNPIIASLLKSPARHTSLFDSDEE